MFLFILQIPKASPRVKSKILKFNDPIATFLLLLLWFHLLEFSCLVTHLNYPELITNHSQQDRLQIFLHSLLILPLSFLL